MGQDYSPYERLYASTVYEGRRPIQSIPEILRKNTAHYVIDFIKDRGYKKDIHLPFYIESLNERLIIFEDIPIENQEDVKEIMKGSDN